MHECSNEHFRIQDIMNKLVKILSNLSLRSKLMAGSMLTTIVALFVAGSVMAAYDVMAARAQMVSSLQTIAKIIADNSTAANQF